MIRSILGAIAGYVVFMICLFALYTGYYLVIGTDRSFLPGKYDPSIMWFVGAFILGFVAAAIGGYVAALIGKNGGAKVMIIIMVVISVLGIVGMLMQQTKPDEVRTGDVPNLQAMMKAKQPLWVAVVNPIVGILGILAGAGMRKNK